MARLPRFAPVGIPQHVIQRGNNRHICFGCDQDLAVYVNWLKEYARQFYIDVHAWVFMTNHVHLLLTPKEENAVSNMMQALGRRYVRYFNRKYQRTGTLWEGRFKSSLVQTHQYLLQCQRYIELNPVRAGIVKDPGDYRWSSYKYHGLGLNIELCTPHREYIRLGRNKIERIGVYRSLFQAHVDNRLFVNIRSAANKGLVFGSDEFRDELEVLCGQSFRPAKMGRPKKVGSDETFYKLLAR